MTDKLKSARDIANELLNLEEKPIDYAIRKFHLGSEAMDRLLQLREEQAELTRKEIKEKKYYLQSGFNNIPS